MTIPEEADAEVSAPEPLLPQEEKKAEKPADAFPMEVEEVLGMPEPKPEAPEADTPLELPEAAPMPTEEPANEEPATELPETLDLSKKSVKDFPPTAPEEGPEIADEEPDNGITKAKIRVGEAPSGPVQDPHLKRLSAEEMPTGSYSAIRLMSAEAPAGKKGSGVVFANGEMTSAEENVVKPVAYQEDGEYPTYMPQDEYLTNGKQPSQAIPLNTPDRKAQGEKVRDNWEADMQDQEGTYLYYNTPDGRETVQTGNPVQIYSPRFCSVRQVTDLNIGQQVVKTGDITNPLHVEYQQRNTGADSARQQIQATQEAGKSVITQVGTQAAAGEIQRDLGVKVASDAVGVQERHSDVGVIEVGGKDTAWIADGMERANTWTQREDLRVFIDKTSATEAVKNVSAPSLYVVTEGEKKHEVRVYKVASSAAANPGEFVDFTIFFENAGDLPVGNIVLVDNLPARLEVQEDSAESSVDATFSYEPNKAGSLTLRWEVTQPLSPGEKGAVKFRCKVR